LKRCAPASIRSLKTASREVISVGDILPDSDERVEHE
jgi:hypothetical protein